MTEEKKAGVDMRAIIKRAAAALMLLIIILGTAVCGLGEAATPTPVPEGPIIDPQSIADYIFANGELPDNFITKKEAKALGWDNSYNYVSDVAPGKSIGGDYFGNYEKRLPDAKGRKFYEADCYYTKGKRTKYRVIFSNDGHVWYTGDHYNTFTELFPTGTPGYESPVSATRP